MRIVGSRRPILFRGAHTAERNRESTVRTGNVRPYVEQLSHYVPAPCSEGDTLLPGRDLIGELRRAVAAAEALNAIR
jgi:hypothetical protein